MLYLLTGQNQLYVATLPHECVGCCRWISSPMSRNSSHNKSRMSCLTAPRAAVHLRLSKHAGGCVSAVRVHRPPGGLSAAPRTPIRDCDPGQHRRFGRNQNRLQTARRESPLIDASAPRAIHGFGFSPPHCGHSEVALVPRTRRGGGIFRSAAEAIGRGEPLTTAGAPSPATP